MTMQRKKTGSLLLSAAAMLMMLAGVTPTSAETVQIEANKMTLYHKTSQVIFTSKVHLVRGDFVLDCDRLVAYYSEHDLDHADASGHIQLRHGKIRGTSDKARFDQKSGALTLIGNAVLTQDGNRVEGDQIIHDLNKEQTTVLPSKGGRTHMTIESDNGAAVLPGSNASGSKRTGTGAK